MNTSHTLRLTSAGSLTQSKIVACFGALLMTCALMGPSSVNAQSGRTRERVGGGSSVDAGATNTATHGSSAQRGHASVTGRVVYAETEEPVRGARVHISSRRGVGPAGATVTDDRGHFRFDNLDAGEYYVVAIPVDAPMVGAATFALPLPSGDPQADEAAFAAARMRGEAGSGTSSARVSVEEGQSAEVEIRVARTPRGGQVSGRVVYEDGKPASNAQLTFLNRNNLQGRMVGPTRLSVLTDEHGAYRMTGLLPGDYIVSARLQEGRVIDKRDGRVYGGLVILTYYPSAISARDATPLHIEGEEQLTDINITLVKRSTHTISGALLTRRAQRPLAGVLVRLRNREDMELPFSSGVDDRFTQTDAQGHFTFEQVLDGDYVIVVGGAGTTGPSGRSISMVRPGGAPRMELPPRGELPPRLRTDGAGLPEPASSPARQLLLEKQEAVTVAGADVNNLAIEVSEGGRVSGTVMIEGEGQLPQRLIITSETRPGQRRPTAFVRPAPDGTFTISGVPEGPLSLDVIISPPERLYVKSITANGVDIRREPLQISDGAEISGVEIVLSSDVATLTGRVLSEDGTPLQGATLLLAPADAANLGPMGRGRLIAVTGSGGRFIIVAGPGEYRAVVWQGQPPSNEEALRALAERAPHVSLQAGERKSLDLVAPGPQQ